MNLAFTDTLMLHKIVIFIFNSFSGGPAAGVFWCTYYGVVGGLSGTSAIMTIAMMSVERYICVSRPLDPSSRMTKSRALGIVTFIWVYSCGFSFVPFFGINRYVPEGYLTSCSFDYLSDDFNSKAFVLVFFVAAYCFPLAIICCCYFGIVFSVYRNQQLFVHHSQNRHMPDRNVQNQKRLEIRLAKISFALISLWTLAWTPYAIVALLGIFDRRTLITPTSSMLPAVFCKVASVLDPFVYGLSNRQFKNELARKLLCVCKSKRLQGTIAMPSFIRRVITVDDQSLTDDENAEVSFSDEDQCETSLNGNEFIQVNVRKVSSLNAISLDVDMSCDTSFRNGSVYHHSDSEIGELNNNAHTLPNTLARAVFQPETFDVSSVPMNEITEDAVDKSQVIQKSLDNIYLKQQSVNIIRKTELNHFKSFDTALSSDIIEQHNEIDSYVNRAIKCITHKKVSTLIKSLNYEDTKTSNDIHSKMKDFAEVKSIHIIKIPQVYTIEKQNDVIKLKTRRSF